MCTCIYVCEKCMQTYKQTYTQTNRQAARQACKYMYKYYTQELNGCHEIFPPGLSRLSVEVASLLLSSSVLEES